MSDTRHLPPPVPLHAQTRIAHLEADLARTQKERDALLDELARLLAVPEDERPHFYAFIQGKLTSALYQQNKQLRDELDALRAKWETLP